MKNLPVIILALLIATMPSQVFSAEYWVVGKIVRTFNDVQFGGCGVKLDVPIGTGCDSSWVSFDCANQHLPVGTGSRTYATALVAASLGKTVSLYVDNDAALKQTSTYSPLALCIAKRLDITL